MESTEVNIREVIQAHYRLTAAYNRMMMDIDSRGFFFIWDKELPNDESFEALGIFFFICMVTNPAIGIFGEKPIPPEKSFAIKPYAKHILSMHIRRQYQALYTLYLEQLVAQRKNCSNNAELEELSEIASNIKGYSASLPSLKGITTLSLAALTIIGTLFGISGERVQFAGFPLQIILLVFAIVFTMGIISPYISAFYFKRFLFKDKYPTEEFSSFTEEKAKQLYASSVYKLEDILFESLGGKERKPQEVPIDVILHMSSFALYVVFAALYLLPPIFGLNVDTILYFAVVITLTGFMVYFGFILSLFRYAIRRIIRLS